MRMTTVLNKLLRKQGVWVREGELRVERGEIWLYVVPRQRRRRCSGRGRAVRPCRDRSWRSWRHLDLLGLTTWLRYQIWRVECPHCGVRTEQVPWASPGSRFTRAFEQEVAWLAQHTDLSTVAEYFGIAWRSVRSIVARVVAREWDEDRRLDGLRVIGIDEISYRRHHHYLTVVVDHLSGRVVWAGKDRKAKTLLRFFRKLGPERAALLEAVSVDMWEPYLAVLRKKAPQAHQIYDRFHIVRHLNEAVDKVRRQLVATLKGQARRDLKSTKFPLLKAKRNRSPKDRQLLEEQVRANRPLYRALLLKDDFMDRYTYRSEGWARRFLQGWLDRAMRSRLEPIKRVARMIRNHLDGVVGWVSWQLSNGRLEGMNNRIRLLSHRSFGLHSAEALIQLTHLCCGGITLQRVH
jgi:transposase